MKKRSYSNTRKISLYVCLIGGFLAAFFGIFSLLHPELFVFSVISCIVLLPVVLDLLISARLLLFSHKKFSLVHAWLVSVFLVQLVSAFALSLDTQHIRNIFQMIADSLMILNVCLAVLILFDKENPILKGFYAALPVAALVLIRLYLGQWFVFVFTAVGLTVFLLAFFKKNANPYIKSLLLFEGAVWAVISVISFFSDYYDLLFPIVRLLSVAYIYLFAAYVLETPQEELPVMVPKSEEDLWAEKYLRMLNKKYKSFSEEEMLNEPVISLKTLTEDEAKLLEELFGIVTVRDLAENLYFNMSKEILDEAKLNKK